MPDMTPAGTLVEFPTATGSARGTVVGRHGRWLIVDTPPARLPKLIPAGSCEAVSRAS